MGLHGPTASRAGVHNLTYPAPPFDQILWLALYSDRGCFKSGTRAKRAGELMVRDSSGSICPDWTAWDVIVDIVVTTAWAAAVEQGLPPEDAAAVCDAAVLDLLDRAASTPSETLRAPVAATVRNFAVTECKRIAMLQRRHTIDLRDGRADTDVECEPWVSTD